MGYYAAALAYFDQISGEGSSHRFYDVTLRWLAALSNVLPDSAGILEKIGTYDREDLDQPVLAEVRDQLYFLLGRHYYRRGNFDKAIELFTSVSPESPVYPRAKFFEGVTYVREYKGAPAVEAFKQLLIFGKERPKEYTQADITKYEELANLQLARVFYSTKQYDTSIRYYEKLSQVSPDWLPSLFEASWAYFMKTKNSKALGNIHTLNAPYFENDLFPESVLLKAVIFYKYCMYKPALEAVQEYNETFRPMRKRLKEMLDSHKDATEFFAYAKKVLAGKAGLDAPTQHAVVAAMSDRTVKKTFAWVDELDRELAMLEKSDKAWQTTRISSEVLQELSLQKSLAETDAGKIARERIGRLATELKKLSRDGSKIKIETLNNQAGDISAKARGEMIRGGHKAETIVVDDEHFVWKLRGEYWKDELGYYRFKIQSRCPKGAGN